MAEKLFIYLKDPASATADWLFTDASGHAIRSAESGTLAELVEKNRNQVSAARQIICVLDSGLMHFSKADIPGRNKQRILQAIPFALEDQLAQDIEELHFAVGTAQDNAYPVVAIRHDTLQAVQATLAEHQLEADIMCPDMLLLPRQAETWNLLCLDNRCHLQYEDGNVIHIDPQNLEVMLQLSLQQTEKPASLIHWQQQDEAALSVPLADNISLQTQYYAKTPLSVFYKNIGADSVINLLQGSYKPVSKQTQWWRPWQVAAALTAVVILLQLVSGVLSLNTLKKQNLMYEAEINRIYKQSFPDSKRIVNARVQMEGKLKQLKQSGSQSSDSFVDVLAEAAPLILQTSSLNITGINYHNKKVELQFTVDKLDTAETLKQRLNQHPKLKAEMISASSEDKQVNARLRLEAI